MFLKAYPHQRFLNYLGASILLACIFTIYKSTLRLFFFQDDFFLLSISKLTDLQDFLRFFLIRSDVVYYRPLSMQVWFGLGKLLFGLNPLLFHSLALSVHILNSFLVWFVVTSLVKKRVIAFAVAFLYGTSILHFLSLAWISEFSLIFITTLFLLSLYCWIKGRLIRMYIFITLGFLVHELAIVFPLLLAWIAVFLQKVSLRQAIRTFWPLFILSMVYLLIRLFVFHQSTEGSYTFIVGFNNLKTVLWYILWSLQIPEEMVRQVDRLVPPTVNRQFVLDFPRETIGMSLLLVVLLALTFLGCIKKRVGFRNAVGYLGWFILGLGPFLLLPKHAYPIYGAIASIGLFSFLSITIVGPWEKSKIGTILIMVLLLTTWFITGLIQMRFTLLTHWSVKLAELSETYVQKVVSQSPQFLGRSILVLPDSKDLRLALMEEYGLKVMFRNDLHIRYGEAGVLDRASVYTIR